MLEREGRAMHPMTSILSSPVDYIDHTEIIFNSPIPCSKSLTKTANRWRCIMGQKMISPHAS